MDIELQWPRAKEAVTPCLALAGAFDDTRKVGVDCNDIFRNRLLRLALKVVSTWKQRVDWSVSIVSCEV